MPAVFQNIENIIEVRNDWLDRLRDAAEKAPRRRSRLCLHKDNDDPVQEMLICFCQDSVLPPHKNLNKIESFHVVEGDLQVFLFDDAGHITKIIEMGPLGSGRTFMYRLATDPWHTVFPLSQFVIIHEVTNGPFRPSDTAFPEWAPEEGPGVRAFIEDALGAWNHSTGPVD